MALFAVVTRAMSHLCFVLSLIIGVGATVRSCRLQWDSYFGGDACIQGTGPPVG